MLADKMEGRCGIECSVGIEWWCEPRGLAGELRPFSRRHYNNTVRGPNPAAD